MQSTGFVSLLTFVVPQWKWCLRMRTQIQSGKKGGRQRGGERERDMQQANKANSQERSHYSHYSIFCLFDLAPAIKPTISIIF